MNVKSMQKMMKQAQQMQARLEKEMGDLRVTASAGGGMVSCEMSGAKQLLSVTIDPEVVDPQDTEMLQDLILAAVNEATRKVEDEMASHMAGISDMLGGLG